MILQCTCEHKDQDKLYGKGYRIHNPCKSDSYARCTVCGKEQLVKHATLTISKKEE